MIKILLFSKNNLMQLAMASIINELTEGWPEPAQVISVTSLAALKEMTLFEDTSELHTIAVVDVTSVACYERIDTVNRVNGLLSSGRVMAICQEQPHSGAFQFLSTLCFITLSDNSTIPQFTSSVQQLAYAPARRRIIGRPFQRDRMGYSLLTEREVTVLKRIMSGETNVDIARELYIEQKTVSAHRHNIYIKLGVSTLAGLYEKITNDNWNWESSINRSAPAKSEELS